MKTLFGILIGLVLLTLVSCEAPQAPPTSETYKESNLQTIESFGIQAGRLTIYKYGNDTLYIVEGVNSASPVGITVK